MQFRGSITRGRMRRGVAVGLAVALTGALTVAGALPAFAHPSFSASATFGFAPNTAGGTGAVGSTPPYVAGSTNTLFVRVPFEQVDAFNGSDDTTVDVKATVPAGWTNPVCGPAKTQVNSAATNSTNQPGSDVAGWSCEVLTVGANKVLHWSGPQVVAPATFADSPQFFVFTVTAPSPSVQTSYNGTGGTEGFILDQQYASGATEHWIPNAAFVGTPPAGSVTTVATGLVRTVAAPIPQASGSPASQTITATVPVPAEEFSLSIPSNPGISLLAGAATGNYYPFTGSINAVTLRDTRSAKPAWSVSGQIGDFSPGAIDGKYLGWTPHVVSPGAGALAGAAVASGIDVGTGLKTSRTLASAVAGHDIGTATLGADLDLRLPLNTPAGTYSATLTLTAI